MPRIKSGQFEFFGDGLLTIYETEERKITRAKMKHIRFGNRTVGVSRFWQAKTAGNKVDRMVSVPLSVIHAIDVEVQNVVVMEHETNDSAGQYKIIQIQPKYDTEPPSLYLSLEKLVHPFKDKRKTDGENRY